MKSWKTTASAVAALVTLIGAIIGQLTDGNPETNPDWNVAIPVLFAGLTGLFARDNKVSSESAGAK